MWFPNKYRNAQLKWLWPAWLSVCWFVFALECLFQTNANHYKSSFVNSRHLDYPFLIYTHFLSLAINISDLPPIPPPLHHFLCDEPKFEILFCCDFVCRFFYKKTNQSALNRHYIWRSSYFSSFRIQICLICSKPFPPQINHPSIWRFSLPHCSSSFKDVHTTRQDLSALLAFISTHTLLSYHQHFLDICGHVHTSLWLPHLMISFPVEIYSFPTRPKMIANFSVVFVVGSSTASRHLLNKSGLLFTLPPFFFLLQPSQHSHTWPLSIFSRLVPFFPSSSSFPSTCPFPNHFRLQSTRILLLSLASDTNSWLQLVAKE